MIIIILLLSLILFYFIANIPCFCFKQLTSEDLAKYLDLQVGPYMVRDGLVLTDDGQQESTDQLTHKVTTITPDMTYIVNENHLGTAAMKSVQGHELTEFAIGSGQVLHQEQQGLDMVGGAESLLEFAASSSGEFISSDQQVIQLEEESDEAALSGEKMVVYVTRDGTITIQTSAQVDPLSIDTIRSLLASQSSQ